MFLQITMSFVYNSYLRLAGSKNIWKHKRVRAQAMSTSKGNLASSRSSVNVEDKPDHLLVLVHGILARFA